jgi:hypothetical protein
LLSLALTPADSAQVAFVYYGFRLLGEEALTVRYDDGFGERVVPGSEFNTMRFGTPNAGPFATRNEGTLRVRVAVVHGDTLGTGELSLPIRKDWIWGVSVHLANSDPTRTCFGCMGARAFPFRGRAQGIAADSLYLVWGGNYLSRPAVY